ncbi:uncharacterized protein [Nicotiana sylvestris]|uniref:uncharacterized protein n=1 Tax=Nicotiana sylvestris TaxID=4096 RepID=UPI00388C3C33
MPIPVSMIEVMSFNSNVIPWDYTAKARRKGKTHTGEAIAAHGMTRTDKIYTPEHLVESSKQASGRSVETGPDNLWRKIQSKEYLVVEQLNKTPAHISILALLQISEAHKNDLMKILSEAYVPSNITGGEKANMVGQVLESHKITFHEDELPPEGLSHNKELHITMQCEDYFITRILVNGGSILNICPLITLRTLGKGLHEIKDGAINVKAFDGSQRSTIGEISLCLQMGPTWFDVDFQVIDVPASYNLLLGRPWIHAAGAVVSTLHQAVKFEWNHQEVIIHGDGSNPIYSRPNHPDDRSITITCLDNKPAIVTCNETKQQMDMDSEEDDIPEEVIREVENFENRPKSNLDETEIWMDEEDAEKTAFIIPWGMYCYKMMPFGLKNAVATYMKAMTTIFHDMIHKEIEVYMDDVIIKSNKVKDHMEDLRKFFNRLRSYNLKLNPAKCAFGVPAGKLLGFIVSRRGIELDPSKVKAIQELPPPKNKNDVMSFLGRLNYISWFIDQSTVICEPIFKMLKRTLLPNGPTTHPDTNFIDPIPLKIHDQPAYCAHIEEKADGKPWFHDIKEYLTIGEYPELANATQKRTLRRLSSNFFHSGGILYRRTPDLGLLRCLQTSSQQRVHHGHSPLGEWMLLDLTSLPHQTDIDSNWKGPYMVHRLLTGGALILAEMEGEVWTKPINSDAVKRYYV